MDDPIKALTFHEVVTEEYRRAVETHGDDHAGINRQDAFAHANAAIRARLHSGEVELPIDDAIHAALVEADGRDGASADKILARIARGEVGLSIWPDPMLDVIVTLGNGRRKPWKRVTADDLQDMAALRTRNTNAARRSERRFVKDVNRVYSALVTAGSIEQMVTADRTQVQS